MTEVRAAALYFDSVERVSRMLDQAGVAHALIGGLAVSILVEPRATKDIDFVVGCRTGAVTTLLDEARRAGFQVNDEEAERLLRSHMTRIWGADALGDPLMIDLLLDEHPFYSELLARSARRPIGEADVRTATPEDLLILKVLAARPQDIADATRLVEVYGPGLDHAHLRRWASELEIIEALDRLLRGAGAWP